MEKDISDKLDTIITNQDNLKLDVHNINTSLFGDEKTKQKGWIDQVQSNSKFRRNAKYAGGFLTAVVATWEIIRAKLGF